MEIRRMTPDDYPAIVTLELEVQAIHVEGAPQRHIPFGVTSMESYREILADPTNNVVVAVEEGEIVGYMHYEIIHTPQGEWTYARHVVHVHSLTIKQEHRRKGYGERLMEYVNEVARQQGASHVTLDVWAFNQAAHAFYERLGFTPTQILMERAVQQAVK
jgi:ribosomal protein S18 acetylase RimI-like enzyme